VLDDAGGIAQVKSTRQHLAPLSASPRAQLQFLGATAGDPVLTVSGGRQYRFERSRDYVATVRMEDVSTFLQRWPGRFRVLPAAVAVEEVV
jgi:hypothetical protein